MKNPLKKKEDKKLNETIVRIVFNCELAASPMALRQQMNKDFARFWLKPKHRLKLETVSDDEKNLYWYYYSKNFKDLKHLTYSLNLINEITRKAITEKFSGVNTAKRIKKLCKRKGYSEDEWKKLVDMVTKGEDFKIDENYTISEWEKKKTELMEEIEENEKE